jgi:hypothetical protein
MCGIFALLNNNYEYTEVKEGTTYYTPTKHIKKDYQIDDIKTEFMKGVGRGPEDSKFV